MEESEKQVLNENSVSVSNVSDAVQLKQEDKIEFVEIESKNESKPSALVTPVKAWADEKKESPSNISKNQVLFGGLVTAVDDEERIQKNSKEIASKILKSTSSTHNGVSSFQYHVLENIIQDSLSDFCSQIRFDIQNMHLELLRQFELQKKDILDLFKQHMPNDILLEEITRLREENTRLKLHHG